MPLASAIVSSTARINTEKGRHNSLLASQIGQTGIVFDHAAQPRVVQRATVDLAAATADQEVVPAMDGFYIFVLALIAMSDGESAVRFGSKVAAEATENISILFNNADTGGAVLPHNPHGWFNTVEDNAALVATTTGAGTTSVQVNYIMVPSNYLVLDNGMVMIGADGEPLYVEDAD
jgi:hypothetical protein